MHGDVPIGSIVWFAGTLSSFMNQIESGAWVACDGSQIVIDPIKDEKIFNILGGPKLKEYYDRLAEGENEADLAYLIADVSPMLKKCNHYEVITGIKECSAYQKTVYNGIEFSNKTVKIPNYSFKDLDATTLTGRL